ncbi:MAG: methionine--tRNA ligase [Flavobacteriales bacterium]|nr:methionine--tRNA ligase [Flavobacteriales bacterium]
MIDKDKKFKRYLITSALPYANGPLHIGQIAGAYLTADIYTRFLRLQGKDVVFVCGSDEHGAAITLRAKKDKTSPQEIVDTYHSIIEQSFKDFGIEFDIYHRTSSKLHHETAADFFTVLHESGKFEQKTKEQYYDDEHNQFLADRYIMGTCPKCDYDAAYGDQCEKCGSALSPRELINPKSTISGNVPVLKETTHWYLPMGDYEAWLKEWILDGHKGDWKSNVYGQCKSWIEGGLKSRAMTRDLDWGVKVPLEEAEGKVLYVWLDAPIGYISATKQWAKDHGKNWEDYWKSDDTKLVHFIGKDNIVFHAIIFPILLHAHGEYILPDNVPANEFLNIEYQKISTSRNWAVWLHEYLEDLPNKQDVLRYVLCSIAPETKDSEFTWKDFQARNNNELVAILGNFVNRTLVLTQKYYDGVVPNGTFEEWPEVTKRIEEIPEEIAASIEQYRFREGLAKGMELARLGNQFLAETEPWKLQKTDPEKVQSIMLLALQIAANISIAMNPFLPATCKKLAQMLNIELSNWEQAGTLNLIEAGQSIGEVSLLFEKLEDEVIDVQIEKLQKKAQVHS